ncbi:MAG: MFS transporter [Actinobacteria bacterium]|nr:MFS transporter [Actinomycetota bacterium]
MDEEANDTSRAGEDGEEPGAGIALEITGFRKVLRNRDFRALWIGQGISGIGDWVIVGVLLDTVNRMGGPLGLVWMMVFRFLPAFLFGLLAGVVVDRLERKTIMIVSEIARAVLVVLLAFSNSLAMICGLVFGIECFTLLFGPARDASIPDLVKPKDVMTANSLMSTSTYLTMALGTMIATLILGFAAIMYKYLPFISSMVEKAQFQHQLAFIVDALTFLASAMLIFTVAFPRRWEKRPEISSAHIYKDLKEGLRYMWENQLTRSILGVMTIGFIGGGSLYILGAPFAEQVMGAVGANFTLILTVLLSGVVVGAAMAPWAGKWFPKEEWFGRAVVGFGVTMIFFTFVDFYPLSLIVIFAGGVFLGYLIVTAYTMLHENLAPEVRGRVFAAMQTIMRSCLLVSMGVFAFVAWLFQKLIPWSVDDPVFKSLDLGVMTKSIYPAMLALMAGGALVIVGGLFAIRALHKCFYPDSGEGGEVVEEAEAAT